MPPRETLFPDPKETPLFHVELKPVDTQPVDLRQMGLRGIGGDDYDLMFYTTAHGDGRHSGIQMVQAKIHFDAVPRDDSGAALVADPGLWTSGNDPIAQDIAGSRAALDTLHADHTTNGFSANGLSVDVADVVDLTSFEHMAKAFDRAKYFFEDRANTLKQWEKPLHQ